MIVPPDDVVAAFGADASVLRRLPGGQERTWTDGQVVLKPVDNPVEHTWVCDVFDCWPDEAGIRVPHGLRSPDGSWVYDGWAAHRFVPGRSARMTWERMRKLLERYPLPPARIARSLFFPRAANP